MFQMAGWAIVLGIATSPLWVSFLVMAIPKRMFLLSLFLCVCELVLAAAVMWFFWGGGIGVEAHLAKSWMGVLLFAFFPVLVFAVKMVSDEY